MVLDSIVEFLTGITTQLGAQGIVTVMVFLGVVYFLYKGVKLGMHMALASLAGALFPVIASTVLGLDVPLTVQNVTLYATAGALLYLGIHVGQKVLKLLK